MKIARLPSNDITNGWSAILPAREAKPALSGDAFADWIVLGAGYAGLAAARRLAENVPTKASRLSTLVKPEKMPRGVTRGLRLIFRTMWGHR